MTTFKTVDISGFGGGYEATCQRMLLRGRAWLQEHPDFDFSVYESATGVYGLVTTKHPMAKALDDALTKDLDATGAMHHGCISMLAKIHRDGYEGFIGKAEAEVPDRVYETTMEQITAEVDAAEAEWLAKLATGDDPMEEILQTIGPENIIQVDFDDPDSLDDAAREIARRIKEKEE